MHSGYRLLRHQGLFESSLGLSISGEAAGSGFFFFQPQIYRADGETLLLPPGEYTVLCTRGPEYVAQTRRFVVGSEPTEAAFTLTRWIDPAKRGWYSGDHHVHAAGCAHYDRPTRACIRKT